MNPIILMHGAIGSRDQLKPIAEQLEIRERKVFLLDFSGHGGKAFSENGFGVEVFADEISQLFDQEGIEKADLFGYSMGGYAALWFAHLYPHRAGKIVTLGTKFDWSPSLAENEILKMNPDKIEEKVPAFAGMLRQRHAPNDWRELLARTSAMMFALGQEPLLTKEVLKKINLDVTILLGDQDNMADLNFSKEVSTWLPFGKFKTLHNTPHPIEKAPLETIVEYIIH